MFIYDQRRACDAPCGARIVLTTILIQKVDPYPIYIRVTAARQKDKGHPSFRLPRFRCVLYKDLMPRTEALYIVGDRAAKVLSVVGVATPARRRRLLLRPAYLSASATYKHQFNV